MSFSTADVIIIFISIIWLNTARLYFKANRSRGILALLLIFILSITLGGLVWKLTVSPLIFKTRNGWPTSDMHLYLVLESIILIIWPVLLSYRIWRKALER